MAISTVDFAAFSHKHLYLVEAQVSSSDVMAEAVARLTGRAALKIGIKSVTKTGIVKYSGQFNADVVNDNKAVYRSGTTINGLIALTANAMKAWFDVIVAAGNATTDDEFHVDHVLTESAGITVALADKKDYASNLDLSGGYSVRANVLFRKDLLAATAVHLESMTYEGPVIDPDSLKNQSAVLSATFLAGLGSA